MNAREIVNSEITVATLLSFGASIPPRDLFPTVVPEAATFVLGDPFAFAMAVCLDRGAPAQVIWTIPFDLRAALGHLDPRSIRHLPPARLESELSRLPRKPRYVNDAPRTIHELAVIVTDEYGGDASNLWTGRTAEEVKATFRKIHGVGPGIASMAVLLIEKAYQVRFEDLDRPHMDIKPDVHTRRVLYRLGLSSSAEESSAVSTARRLRPNFPGELDAPLWIIGRRWCSSESPRCGTCPMTGLCPKRIR